MKIRTSYFYQIRNFKQNMIPMSTCISDPDWYHDWQGKNHIFKDKRGILNGLRLQPIIVHEGFEGCGCPCENHNPAQCSFIKQYKEALNKIDFDKMLAGITGFCQQYAKEEKLTEEPIAVLIVYEAPNNPCSERKSLQELFNSHGIECKELDYPINSPVSIRNESFDF